MNGHRGVIKLFGAHLCALEIKGRDTAKLNRRIRQYADANKLNFVLFRDEVRLTAIAMFDREWGKRHD